MRDGEVRTFYIWATENVYVFRADGYMHGEMIRSYNGNDLQALEDFNNEYDRIDQDAETSAIWTEASENWKDQQRIDSVLYEGRRRPTSNDTLSAGASESDRAGDIEREWTNSRTEEEYHEIVNKVREMYGLEPVDYGNQVKTSRELDSENTSPEQAKESGKVSDAKFSIEFADDIAKNQREIDTAYLSAVKKGDMKTAQAMVDEAAREAGYNYHLYHGTTSFGFTKFVFQRSLEPKDYKNTKKS